MRWFALLATGCGLYITDAEVTERVDADLDGVPQAEDCDDTNPDGTVVRDWYLDGDGDGYGAGEAQRACLPPNGHIAEAGDCDDADPDVSPDGTEVCNGRDDDCDDAVDADDDGVVLTEFRPDLDGDGFGDAEGAPVFACDAPVDHAADATDCDDGDPDVHPEADELCNGRDDDCDDAVDDDDDDVQGDPYFRDADGDGFGDGMGAPVFACMQPDGFVDDASDCDDGSADVKPQDYEPRSVGGGGATGCADGDDNDCDGAIDGADPDCTDADGDGLPDGADPVVFVDADGVGGRESVCVRADLTVADSHAGLDGVLALDGSLDIDADRLTLGAVRPASWCFDLTDEPERTYTFRVASVGSRGDPSEPVDAGRCADWEVSDLSPWCSDLGSTEPTCVRQSLNGCDGGVLPLPSDDDWAIRVNWDGAL